MGLKSLMKRLKNEAADTPDTSAKNMGYQRKANIHAGCTPDTSDTSKNTNSREINQAFPTGEAVSTPATPPAPAKPEKQTFMEWQDTWRELDQAFQLHHLNCPTCIAAGMGYGLRCGTGAALYTAYEGASKR